MAACNTTPPPGDRRLASRIRRNSRMTAESSITATASGAIRCVVTIDPEAVIDPARLLPEVAHELLALLDQLEGDADLEPDADGEPDDDDEASRQPVSAVPMLAGGLRA